jgi:hypothetical protein
MRRVQVAGLCACLLLIDFIGRKRSLVLFLACLAIALGPFLRPGGPSKPPSHPAVEPQGAAEPPAAATVEAVDIAMLFFSRMFTYAAFIVIFIYTPEVYPTRIRSYAFGIFNALCRLGGLTSPFVGVKLFEKVHCSLHCLALNNQQASTTLLEDTACRFVAGLITDGLQTGDMCSWRCAQLACVAHCVLAMQSGVRATIGVFMGMALLAAVLSLILPFETKGRELAEDGEEEAKQEQEQELAVRSGGTAVQHAVSRGTNGASGHKGSLDRQPQSRGTASSGASRTNPFHTDALSSQTIGSRAAGESSQVVAGPLDRIQQMYGNGA